MPSSTAVQTWSLCQKGIADAVQFYLAKNGIFAIEDVPEKDMKYAARALHANIVNKPEALTAKDLGARRACRRGQ